MYGGAIRRKKVKPKAKTKPKKKPAKKKTTKQSKTWFNTGSKVSFENRVRILYQNTSGEYAVKVKHGERQIYKRVQLS